MIADPFSNEIPIWAQRTAMAAALLFCGAAVADAEVTKIKDHWAKVAENRAVVAAGWDGTKQLLCHKSNGWDWSKPATAGLATEEIGNYRLKIKDGGCYVLNQPAKAVL